MTENESARPTRIAVLGEIDSVIGFMAVGFDVLDCSTADEARERLDQCASGCAVVFIDEKYAEQIPDALEKYSSSPLPAVIPIPTGSRSSGWSSARLRKLDEKAVGSDIT